MPELNIEESRLLAILLDRNSKHAGQAQRLLTEMYMRNSNGASSCKTNFFETHRNTETVILFLLKYLIFKMNKVNSLSFKLKNKTKIIKHKQPKQTTQKSSINKQVYCIFKRAQQMQLLFNSWQFTSLSFHKQQRNGLNGTAKSLNCFLT